MRYKQLCVAVAASALMGSLFAVTKPVDKKDLGYAMGYQTAKALVAHKVPVDTSAFNQGMQDGLKGKPTQMTEKQIQTTISTFQQQAIKKMQAKIAQQGTLNDKKQQAFLLKNKSVKGVKVLASGLQYKIITAGKGPQPTAKDIVTVNYEGKLLNGKVFDSSYKRGKPASFPVDAVIKGWQQALLMMHQGATWNLYIPSSLAYGKFGAPGAIGPNELLIFKVQLLKIKKS